MREAQIIVLPKQGKDPHLPESYHPISLLPVYIKILAKILSSRLNTVILSLIHLDQIVFFPRKEHSDEYQETVHEHSGSTR